MLQYCDLCCMLRLVLLQIIDPISLPATPNFPANINMVSIPFIRGVEIAKVDICPVTSKLS